MQRKRILSEILKNLIITTVFLPRSKKKFFSVHLDEQKRIDDDEAKERSPLFDKYRNIEHEVETCEQLEEET